MSDEPCVLLEWDSNFFGVPIARVQGTRLTPETASQIDAWQRAHAVRCLYFTADVDDATTARLAEAGGYLLVDVRLTFGRAAQPADVSFNDPTLRLARPEDKPALMDIARVSHRDTRFYYDHHFPREKCDALYARWIEKAVEGSAQAVWVAESDSRPAGYVTCHADPAARTGSIGLIAVAESARGQGLGSRLTRQALGWLAAQGLQQNTVVTQGRNVPAQRLYQKHGFLTRTLQLTYHRWWPAT